MTNEELDHARANFAFAQSKAGDLFTDIAAHAARLAREGWTPPEPVDPDLAEAEDLATWAELNEIFRAQLALEAIKRGRELERAEAKPSLGDDDEYVDCFAEAMKAKMQLKSKQGRAGWQDKDDCTADLLSRLLREHVEKGDPVDVANFAMMLHQRGERIAAAEAKPGMVWVKHDGSIKCPVVDKNAWVWVRVKGCHDPYISPPQTLHWPVITHYAIITQPENAA